ncbi:G2/mitotic-specific cyclin-B3 [Chelonus insularis]|uniref:G2/mitotic-specific cyclin-B3 n=1 Tax=Chelonus insularis TaxID=460826 RepID=UPI00158AE007|nr:G2/mitotic-specific cyclin-B3 [Chelonus insularis]XP_034933590.1 G2/mitotic-specific cyclin-B3 [Chelonus insularis]
MPLPKVTSSQNKTISTVALRSGVTTRNQQATDTNNINNNSKPSVSKDLRTKRKAEASPLKNKTIKRSALENITNAIAKTQGIAQSKKIVKKVQIKQAQPVKANDKPVTTKQSTNIVSNLKSKLTTKSVVKKKPEIKKPLVEKVVELKKSEAAEKSDDSSLYVSALEDVSGGSAKKSSATVEKAAEKDEVVPKKNADQKPKEVIPKSLHLDDPPYRELPEGMESDFDIENWRDPYQVSQYASEIFEYLKSRESQFVIDDYMENQTHISAWMRSLLVDWMVEVQESFELNHETLYLAVKLVDLYLSKINVMKEILQLLGAASLFIASKFDERIPPLVEDFLYICDGAYSQRELMRMEMSILKTIDFDLGIPLSYRFLRRYARCIKVSMPTLTLARYILEYSLMDYETVQFSDSKIAVAALVLALMMKDLGGWSTELEYYTGYQIDDIRDIVFVLNNGLHRKPKDELATVRHKYSHKIFFEVAKIPLKRRLDI